MKLSRKLKDIGRHVQEGITMQRVLMLGGLVALMLTTAAPTLAGSCQSLLCFKDSDCERGVCKAGLCARGRSVTTIPARFDPLHLGVTSLRLTDVADGPTGRFTIEGLKKQTPVVSLAWAYAVGVNTERRTIVGAHAVRGQKPARAEMIYDENGIISDDLSRDAFFTNVLRWFIQAEQVPSPRWIGEYFTAGSLLTLITMPCTSCEGEWCSCSDD
jgi:hypothetical protein